MYLPLFCAVVNTFCTPYTLQNATTDLKTQKKHQTMAKLVVIYDGAKLMNRLNTETKNSPSCVLKAIYNALGISLEVGY